MNLAKPTMKTNFRKTAVLAALVFFFAGISSSSAQMGYRGESGSGSQNAEERGGTTEKTEKKACARFPNLESKVGQRMDERMKRIQSRVETRTRNMNQRRETREENLAEFRKKRDERREEYYKKLEERAKTTEQKNAVSKFQSQIEAAVKTRRAAIDAAIVAFQKGMDEAISGKTADAEAAAAAFQAAVKAALSEARSDCEDGDDPNAVRTTLRAKTKSAHETFQTARKNYEDLKSVIDSLSAVRKQAVQKAIDDFKVASEKAKTEFKESFSESEE